MKRKKPNEYPIRRSLYGEECRRCTGAIDRDQRYRDGGYSRRYHLECADAVSEDM